MSLQDAYRQWIYRHTAPYAQDLEGALPWVDTLARDRYDEQRLTDLIEDLRNELTVPGDIPRVRIEYLINKYEKEQE